jgi:hypothetical protein
MASSLELLLLSQGTAWTAFTAQAYDMSGPTAVACTVNHAAYKIVGGDTCVAYGDVTFNATTTGGGAVSLPLGGSVRLFNIGTLAVFGASTPAGQMSIAYMSSDLGKVIVVNSATSYLNVTSGQTLRYMVTYPIAGGS